MYEHSMNIINVFIHLYVLDIRTLNMLHSEKYLKKKRQATYVLFENNQ